MRCAQLANANLIVEPIHPSIDLDTGVVSFCCADRPAILESSLFEGPYSRYTILASEPADVFETGTVQNAWAGRALKSRILEYPSIRRSNDELDFACGWIGFLGYESGLAIEATAPPCRSEGVTSPPLARFCLYDAAIVYDHLTDRWSCLAVEWPHGSRARSERPSVKSRLRALRSKITEPEVPEAFTTQMPRPTTAFTSNMSYESYLTRVDRAKHYIESGDIYEVNLTQRLTATTGQAPGTIYNRLRRLSPSSHAAFLQWNDPHPTAVISSSPELFLHLRDGHVVTRPIKGTRPRVGDPPLDAAYRQQLVESEKDRAELNMIIDLVRNDLGRVCTHGTVRVLASDQIEDHPTVFHRVATIEGVLDPRFDWLDLLEATFPGGSITGTPKIRAMQIIDELEPTPRGVYCGAIGYIGLDGTMSMNIAIRTIVQVANMVHIHAGGAIVADSRPEDEYDELMAKADAMLRAVGGSETVTAQETRGASHA